MGHHLPANPVTVTGRKRPGVICRVSFDQRRKSGWKALVPTADPMRLQGTRLGYRWRTKKAARGHYGRGQAQGKHSSSKGSFEGPERGALSNVMTALCSQALTVCDRQPLELLGMM